MKPQRRLPMRIHLERTCRCHLKRNIRSRPRTPQPARHANSPSQTRTRLAPDAPTPQADVKAAPSAPVSSGQAATIEPTAADTPSKASQTSESKRSRVAASPQGDSYPSQPSSPKHPLNSSRSRKSDKGKNGRPDRSRSPIPHASALSPSERQSRKDAENQERGRPVVGAEEDPRRRARTNRAENKQKASAQPIQLQSSGRKGDKIKQRP